MKQCQGRQRDCLPSLVCLAGMHLNTAPVLYMQFDVAFAFPSGFSNAGLLERLNAALLALKEERESAAPAGCRRAHLPFGPAWEKQQLGSVVCEILQCHDCAHASHDCAHACHLIQIALPIQSCLSNLGRRN